MKGPQRSLRSPRNDEVVEQENPNKVKSKSPKKRVEKEKTSNKNEKPKEKITTDFVKELIPSKSGVFKHLKKMSQKSQASSDDQSPTICKAQLNRRRVIVREIPAPVSPTSK